jgi:hypothetical protein
MRHHDLDHYLNSPSFLRIQLHDRSLRKLYLDIKGIEPRSKRAMPDADKLRVQTTVLRYLLTRRRRAFRCPLAVKVRLETTERNPSHPHTIVKNLLDLLADPAPGLPTRRRALVYHDDSQISALSVTCHHGRPAPSIHVEVSPLRDLLDPLEMAWDSADIHEDDNHWDKNHDLDMAGDYLADLRADELLWRRKIGNDKYEALERFARQRVQEPFFGRGGLTASDLAMMFNLPGRGLGFDSSRIWDEAFASSLFRVRLTELPQSDGQSTTWKSEVNIKLDEFRKTCGRLVDPLLVPVALEVVIRPPPPSRQNNVHDLDNVLRSYLLPHVLHTLKPPSHYAFTIGDLAERPPLSTRIGVSRYEAWRLPPAPEGSNGFVSLAIVTDMTGYDGGIDRIEDAIDKWVTSLS